MFNLFSKKKKFKANCDLSGQMLARESAYMVSTAEIISSKKFWDNIMTVPETMTYTEAHFKSGDATATNIRSMIFKKYATKDKAWLIADSELHLFDLDETRAKSVADAWWDSEGKAVPQDLQESLAGMSAGQFEQIQHYAVHEAGRHLVRK